MTAATSRYSRQIRFDPIGEVGQARISSSKVLLCGCGALGSVIADRLARSGVGQLRIVDRDWVELSNLQRQSLFNEQHAAEATPKSVAAAEALAAINSTIDVQACVDDLSCDNISELAKDCDLLIDGTDNFETRFLINDFCVKHSVPWVHGGCVGGGGQVLTILPGKTACFRCLLPDLPPRDAMETCDSAGVLGPAIGIVASWQAAEAIKILSGNAGLAGAGMIVIDSWHTQSRVVKVPKNVSCPACGAAEDYPFLDGRLRTASTILCGKNAVQLDSPSLQLEPLERLHKRLSQLGKTTSNPFFVRLQLPPFTLTFFSGGRTVVEGTTSAAEAKTLVARTLGS